MRKNMLVAYESRFARCGGITAVLNFLPIHLRASSGLATSVITPFHYRITDTNSLPVRLVGKVDVPFDVLTVEVKIYRYDDRWPWYFLDAQEYLLPAVWRLASNDERFFSGGNHPYDVGSNAREQWSILRRDALFFGAAVARALPVVGGKAHWSVIMQDWQAATTALAIASDGTQDNHRLFLTLHNSYDSGPVEPNELQAVGIRPESVPGPDLAPWSVLKRVFPFVERPIFTVSEQFARDFTNDIFQIHVMANHLQRELLPPNILGVNNGLFVQLAVPESALAKASTRRPDYASLREWKNTQKQNAIKSLREFQPNAERPVWGNLKNFTKQTGQSKNQLPWFVLAGRDDTRQKGYDVACHAIRSFLSNPKNRPRAQFLFFPIPGDEGCDGLYFLEQLAQDFSRNVLVLPFIFQEGFLSALRGAAFGIMPSFYEPFGMANEFYLNGAVGIGRATGGLLQQIVPLRSVTSCTSAVIQQSGHWHSPTAPPTGLLYREPDDLPEPVQGWRAINDVRYLDTPSRNRLEERRNLPLFIAMADALAQAIEDALAVYHQPVDDDGRQVYFTLLVQGIGHLQRGFSWELAAAEYNSYMQ